MVSVIRGGIFLPKEFRKKNGRNNMGKIVLLDELTINQIAAGEVIERPASVVKELVENSIDAGAKHITVEIKNGGISYIRVSDDGSGIASDDLEIAFERHATSKIRKADDLEVIHTMGFRGEALASVASIANVELVSKTEEANLGYKVTVEAGEILEKEETGCQKGTTITVRNLFFNTPVRYKFLKKDYTESGYIEDAMTRAALVNPGIAFQLINTGKTVIKTPGDGSVKNCIYSIYGKDIANGIIDVDYLYEDVRVQGVIGKPVIARNNRSQQMFFVNQRFVKDKTLTAAIEQAYKGMLTIGKHAFCILNLKMDPAQVDVNVHPAKLEVRFKEENKIFKAIYNAIKESLLKTDLVRDPEQKIQAKLQDIVPSNQVQETKVNYTPQAENAKPEVSSLFHRQVTQETKQPDNPAEPMNLVEQLYYAKQKENQENLEKKYDQEFQQAEKEIEKDEKSDEEMSRQIIADILAKRNPEKAEEPSQMPTQEAEEVAKVEEDKKETPETVKEEKTEENSTKTETATPEDTKSNQFFRDMYQKAFGTKIEPEKEKKNDVPEVKEMQLDEGSNLSVFEDKTVCPEQVPYKFIGIVFSTYIILEIGQEMYILDQHAAHERIMYEKVKKNFYRDDAKDCQLMLLPDVITLTHKEMDIARENYDLFAKAGFELEEFGENTIKLTGVPTMCLDLDTKELFLEILDAIDTVAITAIQEKEEKFIATIACKSAVKANMALTKEEVDALMRQLLVLPNPFTCPHGRPTSIRMTKTEIEKKFSRR